MKQVGQIFVVPSQSPFVTAVHPPKVSTTPR
eukprot:COSAG06_NODE_26607_length_611_cov_0.800781_2_plen_30_part_01